MKKISLKQFLKRSRGIHGNKYDYSWVIYKNGREKVKIGCPHHGIFYQSPYCHTHGRLTGQGCPKCKHELLNKINTSTLETFKQKSNGGHAGKYEYSLVKYTHSKVPVEIICRKHGVFLQRPNDHLLGHGCPKCINIISNKEKSFLDCLQIPDTKENRQVLIGRKKVDGLKDNTVYEFLGDYWHGNPKKFRSEEVNTSCKKTHGELYSETFKRFEKLKTMGYNVKYIWESDWKDWNKTSCWDLPIQTF